MTAETSPTKKSLLTLRGLEPQDSVTISGPREILFDTSASTLGDYVRVLTAFSAAAVPEPSAAYLSAVDLAAMGVLAKRFRYPR